YALSLERPAPLEQPATPRFLGVLPEFTEPATGADLSRDGLKLAVCSYALARVYHRESRDSDRWLLEGTVRYAADLVEAVAWGETGDALILAGEGRGLYRIAAKAWLAVGTTPDP